MRAWVSSSICGLLLRLYRDEFKSVGGSIRFRIASFIEVTGRKGVALFGGIFLVLVALLLTGSRGAIGSTALGLFVLGALTLRLRKRQFAEQREAIIVICALLVAATFVIFGDIVVGKITQQGLHDENRMAVYTIAMRSIFDAPLLGYGYGTFADVFPMFRDQSVGTFGKWPTAHNTYLEVFQGLGLLFGAMLIAIVITLVLRCLRGAMQAANGCHAAMRGGERRLSVRSSFPGGFQLPNSGHRDHLCGLARGRCGSV